MAEVSSALPFGGGVFGLSRCSLGYFLGFVVGACECLYYILYTSALTLTLGDLVAPTIGDEFVPLVLLGTITAAVLFHVFQNRWLWHLTAGVVVLGLGLLALYCAGVWRALHDATSSSKAASSDSGWTLLQLLPLYTHSFIGIDALASFADYVQRPVHILPVGQARASYSVLLVSALVFATSAIVPPATTAGGLTRGFREVLGISDSSAALVSLLLIVPAIGAFVLTSSNTLTGLAKSSLVDRHLARPLLRYNCYPRTLLLCGVLSFGAAGLARAVPLLGRNLYNVSFLFAMPTYMAHAYGYVFLRAKFPGLKRQFVSPLGRQAGVYAICVFGLCWISLLVCQDDSLFLSLVAVATAMLLTVYYHCHAKRHQSLSEDERKIFFFAHVRQRNEAANHHRRRRPSSELWQNVRSRRVRELIQLHGAQPKSPGHLRQMWLSSNESMSRELQPKTRVVPHDTAQATTTRPAAAVEHLELQDVTDH
ncbi:hypothetical protein SPRG_09665 [Saprolegnia parasitica CBS 223.65]|uniref:Amino acid permease/ SLC12A domain-containing protein n=1 Tax=Saprolegnia parasitica (strain CBS 223.65) TaxID=695850 RepID=A0A067CDD9_SAPPC|nr:hypothetical protein SPRG_09665 [Saprolegnia parasitica CBS 223.65]KDO24832.1 hypothetical protein SPRG_09665 [Saprolegnia parasitica CBS 223.65]|eukprot:XP_012204480.1 hypothetical protein SPRG_09665 [Saprolegnia parasitica CBS 223.65]